MACGQEKKENYYCEFIQMIQHDDLTYTLEFKSDHINNWHEGDHSMLILNVDDTLIGKKLFYTSLPEDKVIRFTTRISDLASDYKKALLTLVKGEFVKISEPSGDFRLKRMKRPVLMLTSGVGIAGVKSLLDTYILDQSDIPELILFNVDSKSDIFKDQYNKLNKLQSYYLSNRTSYYSMLTHELRMISKRYDVKPLFYLSGSDDFVEENLRFLKDLEYETADTFVGGKQSDSCCR